MKILLPWLLLTVIAGTALAEPIEEARKSHLQDLAGHYRNLQNGESVVELSSGDDNFIALAVRQRTATPQGGVLILHDQGHNPDWPHRLQQSRRFLPDVGWDTLSIAMPTTNGRSEEPVAQQTLDRIAAGLQQLNRQGLFNIVLLGYGDGAYWAARYMAERLRPQDDIGYALVMVETTPDRADLPELLGRLTVPVLDLYFNPGPWARANARERKAEAARNKLQRYTQILDPPGGSFYSEAYPSRSTRRLWGWLRNNAAGREGDL